MSILRRSTAFQAAGTVISLHQLESQLEAESACTLLQLLHVLNAPADIPCIKAVIESVCEVVSSYGLTLAKPSPTFHLVQRSLEALKDDIRTKFPGVSYGRDLEQPLLRRLAAHAPYALCLTLAALKNKDIVNARAAAGVEIASCLATAQRFRAGFAKDIRRTLTPELFGLAPKVGAATNWSATYVKTRAKAARFFEADESPDPQGGNPVRLFDITAGYELARKARYSPPRQRQAILDRRHQTIGQLKASAAILMEQGEQHDYTALLTMIAFCTGLSLRLTQSLPIASCLGSDNWLMRLDIDSGVIMTNLEPLFPKAAIPMAEATCFRIANRIAVKPLPTFLSSRLKALHAIHPEAEVLAELLPGTSISGRQLTLMAGASALAPTTKRFLTAAAPLAVMLGVDRLSAALVANDFSVVPGSKMYYCHVRREEIWAASIVLFDCLGWGAPVPIVGGLPLGSRIVPTRAALKAWYHWMVADVASHTPGRHCLSGRLIAYHNSFARLCASLSVLCLATREVRELRFNTHNLCPEAAFASLFDKQVGIYPGEMKVPVNEVLRNQLRLWMAHCKALRRRLMSLQDPATDELMSMLDSFLCGERCALFFLVDSDGYQTVPLSSAALRDWWPWEFSFTGDFGRHLWECELRDAGVRSSRIDVLMRHITLGVEAHCSTNGDKLADVAEELTAAQEQLFESLGIKPVPGLVAKI